ncbi:hypothetical protein BJ875DRAFT_517942 [Amylocarpus encephaloides]|uniref:Glycosyltransferase family 31 protein n=1 Tax=Amylocarpus encephaloides TaxID=45428 RepID=A0A9P7YDQ1_9HELO|nr:hypothetical protein BJ875DRAFT_517942 [Amylocarpus encephaloides]
MRFGSRASLIYLRSSIFTILVSLWYFFCYLKIIPSIDAIVLDGTSLLKNYTSSESCPNFPATHNIVVSIKTGATEAVEKVPALMQTSLRCVENVFFFSDLEQDIGEYHMYDALDTISTSLISDNTDFEFYSQQKALWEKNRDISSLHSAKNPEAPEVLAAWTLDKYKFIHILEKTWAMKPDMDWYILIDADTYVLWSNLMLWLDMLDPTKKSYFGSEVNIAGTSFAHGGSGIILSKALMYEIAVIRKGVASQWDSQTRGKCCGDLVLAQMMLEYGTGLQDVWPLMSGERPSSMPFGPGSKDYWCKPALTMHHLSPTDMKQFADFEERSNNTTPLTHADILNELWLGSMTTSRQDWDNQASDPGEFGQTGGVLKETASFEDCIQACEDDEKCFQYSHHGNKCHIGMSVRYGDKKKADDEGKWYSGWNMTRLADWISKQPHCDKIEFPVQSS